MQAVKVVNLPPGFSIPDIFFPAYCKVKDFSYFCTPKFLLSSVG